MGWGCCEVQVVLEDIGAFSDGQLIFWTAGMGEDIAHLEHSLSVGLSIGACSGLGHRVPRRWW